MIGLLTAKVCGQEIIAVFEDPKYGIPGPFHAMPMDFEACPGGDLFLCVHGRKIVPKSVLDKFQFGGVNIHPFLDKYPGADPVRRAIQANEQEASVFAHRMSENVDEGEILAVEKIRMPMAPDVVGVYNALYGAYSTVIMRAIACMVVKT